MPIYKYGNMWDAKTDITLVTTNSYIKTNGQLAMGRGTALQALRKYGYLAALFGKTIRNTCGHLGKYGVIIPLGGVAMIGAFQVKYHYLDNADLELIDYSCKKLIDMYKDNPNPPMIAMNYPAIGWGHRNENEVAPIIAQLPDYVSVYRL